MGEATAVKNTVKDKKFNADLSKQIKTDHGVTVKITTTTAPTIETKTDEFIWVTTFGQSFSGFNGTCETNTEKLKSSMGATLKELKVAKDALEVVCKKGGKFKATITVISETPTAAESVKTTVKNANFNVNLKTQIKSDHKVEVTITTTTAPTI